MHLNIRFSVVLISLGTIHILPTLGARQNMSNYTALRFVREAPSIASAGSGYIRTPQNGFRPHHSQSKSPTYRQVETESAKFLAPIAGSGGEGLEGYSNNSPQNGHNHIGTFNEYAPPPPPTTYLSPLNYHHSRPTSSSQGNFDTHATFNNGPQVHGPYSSSLGSSYHGMSDWYHQSDTQQKQNGWGWMKEERPVNFSAVGLLGLLALMGMIQHVMTDMDTSTPKPNSETSFVSGNSMGSRPRPKPSKPMTMTTTPKPKISKRSLHPHNPLIDQLSKAILPSYDLIAEGLECTESFKDQKLDCSRFHAWKIFTILTRDFQVPKDLAFSSISRSLKVMREHQEDCPEAQTFWKTWNSKEPNYNSECILNSTRPLVIIQVT